MATVWGDTNGKIIAAVQNLSYLQIYYPSGPPAGTVTTLDFDETANPALIADIINNPIPYSLTGGTTPVLTKSGVTQVVTNIPGASTAWTSAIAQLNSITPDQVRQIVTLLLAGTATTAQAQKALGFVILKLEGQLL